MSQRPRDVVVMQYISTDGQVLSQKHFSYFFYLYLQLLTSLALKRLEMLNNTLGMNVV